MVEAVRKGITLKPLGFRVKGLGLGLRVRAPATFHILFVWSLMSTCTSKRKKNHAFVSLHGFWAVTSPLYLAVSDKIHLPPWHVREAA